MNKLVRKLPLHAKLMLIALIPFCFLIFLTWQIYEDKTEKLELFRNYKEFVASSGDISGLIDAMQDERKYSFDYVITKSAHRELMLQRPQTDSFIERLIENRDPSLVGFRDFTRLGELQHIRNRVDSAKANPSEVMHYYSNTVFRLNTLNTLPPANTAYLDSVYNDLMSQKILSEMITYLGIIRSNMYNVLVTREYMIETLFGTVGTHDIYKSYEGELLAKAGPEVLQQYNRIRKTTALQPTLDYIHSVFTTFDFGGNYTGPEWWDVSDEGERQLRKLQLVIKDRIDQRIDGLYNYHYNERNKTVIFLIFGLIIIFLIVFYIMFMLSSSLRELRIAAETIANGETEPKLIIETDDAIGRLGVSILKIARNNRELANAAAEIGKGNFGVQVEPRTSNDILGNAIAQMKSDLEQYSTNMKELVADRTEELARSNEDLQQFAHVASHDLKEPLRKIGMFSNILNSELAEDFSEKGRIYLHKIELAAGRMSKMIEGVLAYSTVAVNEPVFEMVDLNKIMEGVENDLELIIIQKDAKINYDALPRVSGVALQLHQVFYNLINNALKFSKVDVPPRIDITSGIESNEAGKKEVHIIISDNGIGFDTAYTDRMFGVFFRLNSKDKYEGTGLGLALCRKIITRHRGRIYAEGKEGEGAIFHIYLPYKA